MQLKESSGNINRDIKLRNQNAEKRFSAKSERNACDHWATSNKEIKISDKVRFSARQYEI